MPELPDVEVFRRQAERGALARAIARVDAPRSRVLGALTQKALRAALVGESFRGTDRHGKHLLLRIAGDGVLGMHFGLTGWLDVGAGDGEPGASARLVVGFADGRRLIVADPRRFGRVSLAADRDAYVAEHGLGPDALAIGREELVAALGARRGALKPALMDQALIAGIGNVYADEILFQARLHPQRRIETLAATELTALHRTIHAVLAKAIERDADRARLPGGWLTPVRKVRGAACPRCGAALSSAAVGGRTTVWCPACQSGR